MLKNIITLSELDIQRIVLRVLNENNVSNFIILTLFSLSLSFLLLTKISASVYNKLLSWIVPISSSPKFTSCCTITNWFVSVITPIIFSSSTTLNIGLQCICLISLFTFLRKNFVFSYDS